MGGVSAKLPARDPGRRRSVRRLGARRRWKPPSSRRGDAPRSVNRALRSGCSKQAYIRRASADLELGVEVDPAVDRVDEPVQTLAAAAVAADGLTRSARARPRRRRTAAGSRRSWPGQDRLRRAGAAATASAIRSRCSRPGRSGCERQGRGREERRRPGRHVATGRSTSTAYASVSISAARVLRLGPRQVVGKHRGRSCHGRSEHVAVLS